MAVQPGAYPKDLSPEVKDLISNYYYLSNAHSTHNDDEKDEHAFADLFTEDGWYAYINDGAKGRNAIYKLRHEIFEKHPYRDHRPLKFFANGDLDLMVWGETKYTQSNKSVAYPWAARHTLEKVNGEPKIKSISIISDPQNIDAALQG